MHSLEASWAWLIAMFALVLAGLACSSITSAEFFGGPDQGQESAQGEAVDDLSSSTADLDEPSPAAPDPATAAPPTAEPTETGSPVPAECERLTPEECVNRGTHEYLRSHEIHPYCQGDAFFTEATGTFTITFFEDGARFATSGSEFEAERIEPNIYSFPTSGNAPNCREGISTITFGPEGFAEDHACRLQEDDNQPCLSFEFSIIAE